MNCNDVSTVLDERRERHLTAAERCAIDTHLVTCADCAHAWHAQAALRALPIPHASASLLERALALQADAPRRRATPRLALGAALLAAGAALAAVTYLTVSERAADRAPADAPPPSTTQGPARNERADQTPPVGASVGPNAPAASAQDVDRSLLPDSDYFLVSRTPPTYPPAALEQQLEGSVTIEFTITKEGRVADAIAVEPMDAVFASAAVAAISRWTYLPRVIDGERVAAHDVKTVIRFQLVFDQPPAPTAESDAESALLAARWARLELTDQRLEAAWKCLAVQELRCAELILDELVATAELTPEKAPQVWDFYGYLYTQYGDYGRAIAAYEATTRDGKGWGNEWLALAHLYFARNQYDMALKTLLRYKEKNLAPFPGTDEFLERLRLLGITEDVL